MTFNTYVAIMNRVTILAGASKDEYKDDCREIMGEIIELLKQEVQE